MEYDPMNTRHFIGMFFLTFDVFDKPVFKGQVIKKITDECFLCDFFSWFKGEWEYSSIQHIDKLKEFRFFQNIDHLNEYITKKD